MRYILRTTRIKAWLLLSSSILIIIGLYACNDHFNDAAIVFVGDSIVARWDVNQDFPSYYVYNYGVGGSGIDLLQSYSSKFIGNDVVVLSGTNDHYQLTESRKEDYAQAYIQAILNLTNQKIYLFSILPRDFKGDRIAINKDILDFNRLIKEKVKNIERIVYIDAYFDFMQGDNIKMRYYSDGLHPNAIGYEILTQKLLKAL